MESVLNEFMRRSTPPPPPPVGPAGGGRRRAPQGVAVSHSATLQEWQHQVVRLLQMNKDPYVIVAPGGGKTLPIVTYWAETILGINPRLGRIVGARLASVNQNIVNLLSDTRQIPKILIGVPTRSLARNTYTDFIEHFSDIYLGIINLAIQENEATGNYQIYDNVMQLLSRFDNRTGPGSLDDLRRRRNALRGTFTNYSRNLDNAKNANPINPDHIQQIEIDLTNLERQIQQLDLELSRSLSNAIRNHIEYHLVYLQTGDTRRGNPREALVSITIYESLPGLFSKMNNLKLLVIDEAHLIQRALNQEGSNDRADQICSSLYHVLKQMKGNNNIRLAFLSGTVNPSAAEDLAMYIEHCFRRPIVQVANRNVKNTSTINVVPADWVANQQKLVNLIKKPEGTNNLIVVFSKARIDQLVQTVVSQSNLKTAQQIDQGGAFSPYQKRVNLASRNKYYDENRIKRQTSNDPNLDRVSRRFNPNTQEMKDQINSVGGAGQIEDTQLAHAVKAGIGYIYRIDTKGRSNDKIETSGRDQQIVERLFKEGKIHTLLSTDAVGIGVNITVRNLYISSTEKPAGGGQTKPMLTSDLSQLLNRVGRGAYNVATVYTPVEYAPNVIDALDAGIDKFEKRVTVERIPEAACMAFSWFKTIWNRLT